MYFIFFFFFFQAEDGIRDLTVTGVQTCALPILISESAFGRNCAAPTTRNVSGRGSSDAIASAIPRWPNCMVSPGRKSGDTLGPCRQADLKRERSRSRRAWPVARHEAAPQQGARPLGHRHDDAGDDRRDRAADENLGGDGKDKTEGCE